MKPQPPSPHCQNHEHYLTDCIHNLARQASVINFEAHTSQEGYLLAFNSFFKHDNNTTTMIHLGQFFWVEFVHLGPFLHFPFMNPNAYEAWNLELLRRKDVISHRLSTPKIIVLKRSSNHGPLKRQAEMLTIWPCPSSLLSVSFSISSSESFLEFPIYWEHRKFQHIWLFYLWKQCIYCSCNNRLFDLTVSVTRGQLIKAKCQN